jgi:hypothetical protein
MFLDWLGCFMKFCELASLFFGFILSRIFKSWDTLGIKGAWFMRKCLLISGVPDWGLDLAAAEFLMKLCRIEAEFLVVIGAFIFFLASIL